ncbi:transposase [Oenococcus oeni]|uniref:transposase n=1 Tax=Oenococcus oeni TaxID=1247 RepID=UPI000A830C61|nr:transposase [Oenococcus oeni]
MINYYQTHDESLAEVAGKYNVLACQISVWRKTLIRDGYSSLEPHHKGRSTKTKRSKKQIRQLEKQSEIERLRSEIAQKNQEFYDTKLENDILKNQ